MPVETGIYANYLRPPKSINEFAAEEQTFQSNAFKLNDQRRAQADEVATRDAYRSGGGDLTKTIGSLQDAGVYKPALSLMEQQRKLQDSDAGINLKKSQTDENKTKTDEAKYKLEQQQRLAAIQEYTGARTRADAIAIVRRARENKLIPNELADQALANMPHRDEDWPSYAALKRQELMSQTVALEKQIPKPLPAINSGAQTQIPVQNPVDGSISMGATVNNTASPNTVLTEQGQDRRHAAVSGNTAATVGATTRGQTLTDERMRDQNILKAAENDIRRSEVLGDKQNKNMETLSKRLGDDQIPSIYSSLNTVDRLLEPYVTKGAVPSAQGTAQAKGKDIPGFGMLDRITPGFLLSDNAKDIRQNVQSLSNMVLKMRSGAAVTDSEMRRVLTELGQGNFTSEDQILKGLQIIRRVTDAEATNIGAGFDQGILDEYQTRAGFKIPRGGAGTVGPKNVNVGGKNYQAKQAPDGKFYVQTAPGKWAEVRE
jgi:hypothetical protein